MAETHELAQRFWSAFGPALFGQPRAPQTADEWIQAGKQLKALTQLDQLASRLEQATKSTMVDNSAKRQQRPERDSIYYDDSGAACCPIHEKPLREGKWGYYCSCKDENGKNGYCDFRTKSL